MHPGWTAFFSIPITEADPEPKTVYITHHEIDDEGRPIPGCGADAVVRNREADGSFDEYPIRPNGVTGRAIKTSKLLE